MDDIVKRIGHFIPVSRELLEDAAPFRRLMDEAIDRTLRPWNYPDRYAFPRVVLFPRVQRLVDTYNAWKAGREWQEDA